jgi:hypothetical protein
MSVVGRALGLLIFCAGGMICALFAVPIAWVLVRIAGLIPVLSRALGRMDILVYLGGILFGAVAAALVIAAVIKAMGEEDRPAVIAGTVGGAIGGLASSIMFFPIVGLL